jgi:hypothetical protein
MESKIENYNGRNTVVVKFPADSQFNQNSRLQLTIEDAAELMAQLYQTLEPYQGVNDLEIMAMTDAFERAR